MAENRYNVDDILREVKEKRAREERAAQPEKRATTTTEEPAAAVGCCSDRVVQGGGGSVGKTGTRQDCTPAGKKGRAFPWGAAAKD